GGKPLERREPVLQEQGHRSREWSGASLRKRPPALRLALVTEWRSCPVAPGAGNARLRLCAALEAHRAGLAEDLEVAPALMPAHGRHREDRGRAADEPHDEHGV